MCLVAELFLFPVVFDYAQAYRPQKITYMDEFQHGIQIELEHIRFLCLDPNIEKIIICKKLNKCLIFDYTLLDEWHIRRVFR